MGFKDQIAVALCFDHGQQLTGELGRALEIQDIIEEPKTE